MPEDVLQLRDVVAVGEPEQAQNCSMPRSPRAQQRPRQVRPPTIRQLDRLTEASSSSLGGTRSPGAFDRPRPETQSAAKKNRNTVVPAAAEWQKAERPGVRSLRPLTRGLVLTSQSPIEA